MTSHFQEAQSNFVGLCLPFREITKNSGEYLVSDRPQTVQVAEPMCRAGLRSAGILEKPDYHPSPETPVEYMPMHVFTLLLQGEMAMEIGEKTQWIKPGQLVYTPPGSPYRRLTRPNGPVWFLYVEFFDVSEWDILKERGPFCRDYEDASLMYLLLRRILDVNRSRSGSQRARSYSESFLELMRKEKPITNRKTKRQSRKELDELVESIRKEPERPWVIDQMAQQLHISRATLIRLFQSEYGVPPRTLIIHQRIATASRLLIRTDSSISEVASRVGYDSAFTFSNLFLRQTGLRPGSFRKKHRNTFLEEEI